MWDRKILKSNAKMALTGKYWTAFAACLIVSAITGFFSLFCDYGNYGDYGRTIANAGRNSGFGFLTLLVGIFVGLPLAVGLMRFFVQNRFGTTDIQTVFSGFKRNYGNTLGGMFVTYLFVGLWTLLLIVPGIIKGLEYCMVPFILSDNPDMPGDRARKISSMMTSGEKGSIFVLYLSFIGWFILASIPGGFVSRFLYPAGFVVNLACYALVSAYLYATFAELYIFMRDRAIQSGMATPIEFGLVPPANAEPQPPVQ